MSVILSCLSVVNLLALAAAFAVGLLSWSTHAADNGSDPTYPLHFYLGLFGVLFALAVHCLVFIYFLGTGRWVKEVALAYGLPDAPLPRLTRDLKRRTFPVALLAMLVPIATAAAGAAAYRKEWPWQLHLGLGCATLLVNVWAFVVERRNVRINAGIIEDVQREVDRIRAEHGLPSNAEALRQAGLTKQKTCGRGLSTPPAVPPYPSRSSQLHLSPSTPTM
jgi:hypothetical protein